jgi:hypothetical protein
MNKRYNNIYDITSFLNPRLLNIRLMINNLKEANIIIIPEKIG